MADRTVHEVEYERFISDLQDHLEDVGSFWVSQDELREVVRRMLDDGHLELPTNRPDGSESGR